MESQISVHKIGGANMSKLPQVKDLVTHLCGENERPFLVVSAFQGVTNALLSALDKLDQTNFDEAAIDSAFDEALKINRDVIHTHFTNEDFKQQALRLLQTEFDAIKAELLKHKQYTNRLAQQESTYQIRDIVIGFGENIAAKILALYLKYCLFNTQSIDSPECAPLDSGAINRRAIHRAMRAGIRERLRDSLRDTDDSILILGGHIANTPRGMVVDIGRNFTDTTAVNVAKVLGETRKRVSGVVTFWKDVDGLLSGDPRELNSANRPRQITHVSHREGLELASAGSTLLQIESLVLAVAHKIGLRVRNIDNRENHGTVYDTTEIATDAPFKVICTQPCDSVSFTCPDMVNQSGFMETLSAVFKELKINIADPLSSGATLSFMIPLPKDESARSELRRKIERIREGCKRIHIDGEEYEMDIQWLQGRLGNVSVVGVELADEAGILSEITGVLAAHNINIYGVTQEDTQLKVSLYVHERDRRLAAEVLHSYFIDRDPAVREKVMRRRAEISARFFRGAI